MVRIWKQLLKIFVQNLNFEWFIIDVIFIEVYSKALENRTREIFDRKWHNSKIYLTTMRLVLFFVNNITLDCTRVFHYSTD